MFDGSGSERPKVSELIFVLLESLGKYVQEEGRGTRNGYEASKGSKRLSGL